MADRIHGPLYFERMGRKGPVIAFVHPNPMDQSCWLYQMAHFSSWYRCVGIDIPGYGRSPSADKGLTMDDMAAGCWEAVDEAVGDGEPVILVGCSVGSAIVPYMYHQRPDASAAMVLSGTGYNPGKPFAPERIQQYENKGVDYRWEYSFQDMSAAFRTTSMAHYFADLFAERNDTADAQTIIYQFEAMMAEETEEHHAGIKCPAIILTGSEDNTHLRAFALQERIPGCELKTLPGAGHACQLEQPWLFDRFMIEFLTKYDLHPAA